MIFELSHPGAIVYVCGLSPFRSFFLGCISSDIVFSLRFVGKVSKVYIWHFET
ncbi:hypothetical protein HanRHA438_Chr11g0488191 [Helianthus annuus]|nr:hypothetical protein HanRHA438_Chr11g0488191 [Helianthus annuus]